MGNENAKAFAAYLKQILKDRKTERKSYSLREFAFELDYDPSALHKILSGKRSLQNKTIIRLSEALDMTREELKTVLQQYKNLSDE